jgi:hypothetical protein
VSRKKKQQEKPNCIIRALGHKSEPYYKTEKEMLKETHYTYESLSISEKEMYNESRYNKSKLLP